MISPNYKPSGGITLSVGGLAPPSLARRAGGSEDFACGGLPNVSSAPSPGMRSTSLACQMALPVSTQEICASSGHIVIGGIDVDLSATFFGCGGCTSHFGGLNNDAGSAQATQISAYTRLAEAT